MNSGAYRITIFIERDITLNIGALGKCNFKKGYYVYTGSAMRNLRQRIERHCRKEKKLRWHIDFLLASPHVKIVNTEVFLSEKKEECALNMELIQRRGSYIPIPRFGSSDCRKCPSHLVGIQLEEG